MRTFRAVMDAAISQAVFRHATGRLPPSVRIVDGTLSDDYSGCQFPLNPSAVDMVSQLTNGHSVEAIVRAREAKFPEQPVSRDCYSLVRVLNRAGLLNVDHPALQISLRDLAVAPTAVGPLVLEHLASTFATRRQIYVLPERRLALVGRMFACLLPWLLLAVGLVTPLLVIGLLEFVHLGGIVIGTVLLMLSLVIHEMAHVSVLGDDSATVLTSAATFRVWLPSAHRPRLAAAAVAGPLVGAAICALGIVAGSWYTSPAAATLGSIGVVTHLICLIPWAGDGRVLTRAATTPF